MSAVVSLPSFPDRLRMERRRLGLTQEQFAVLGGASKTAQYMYEAGKNWPTCEYLEALRSSGVDVAFIATGARTAANAIDWELLRQAFLLVQHNLASKPDRAFSPDQLFDAFKTAVQMAQGVTRPDLVTQAEN
ncbi:hypothetical protein PROAA_910014 [Candidatus Propionivibrio aalborgensis]|uniref:HTH cro/C1-type domain-containing protein n=1 Tax=Candidatus Propionivibrio aalborgensis TaxID=1860101 RepID=A0A1A8Y440_9RHOO|nr:helix-turn-helix transcriptional regulator [Candidatus Propionivibrio aalborgensis]SBT11153.1 hypothetical protein PROAA_910014 [Candidatus Propionivibrio aalborgensis]